MWSWLARTGVAMGTVSAAALMAHSVAPLLDVQTAVAQAQEAQDGVKAGRPPTAELGARLDRPTVVVEASELSRLLTSRPLADAFKRILDRTPAEQAAGKSSSTVQQAPDSERLADATPMLNLLDSRAVAATDWTNAEMRRLANEAESMRKTMAEEALKALAARRKLESGQAPAQAPAQSDAARSAQEAADNAAAAKRVAEPAEPKALAGPEAASKAAMAKLLSRLAESEAAGEAAKAKRLADLDEAKRQADTEAARQAAGAKRLAEQAKAKRLADAETARKAVETKRLADAAEVKRVADAETARKAVEVKRLADAAEAKRLADAETARKVADAKRIADAAEAKRVADAETARKVAEAKRLTEVAEAKRLADAETAHQAADEKRIAALAEATRIAEVAEAKRLADAEQAQKAAMKVAEKIAESKRLAELALAEAAAKAADPMRLAAREETRDETKAGFVFGRPAEVQGPVPARDDRIAAAGTAEPQREVHVPKASAREERVSKPAGRVVAPRQHVAPKEKEHVAPKVAVQRRAPVEHVVAKTRNEPRHEESGAKSRPVRTAYASAPRSSPGPAVFMRPVGGFGRF